MSLLFETIRIDDGKISHPFWHEERMTRSRQELWNINEPVDLTAILSVPDEWSKGIVRCNIFYDREIDRVQFTRSVKKTIHTLKVIESNEINYPRKYTNRAMLDVLLLQRGKCDEIIIVKHGFITDTSLSNLIFFDGIQWFTPAHPLLNGTCRQRLLKEKRVIEKEIHIDDLYKFDGIKLINAMREPDHEEVIPVRKICR
jgi:4-amino-4-deoxychorismate lyase